MESIGDGWIYLIVSDADSVSHLMTSSWASYQMRKIAGYACAGTAGNVLPASELVSYPGMHHGTCVTHVPWCMSGSLTYGSGKNVPAFPAHARTAILRIWQEAHAICKSMDPISHRRLFILACKADGQVTTGLWLSSHERVAAWTKLITLCRRYIQVLYQEWHFYFDKKFT